MMLVKSKIDHWMLANFGGRRAFLESAQAWSSCFCGRYRAYLDVNWNNVSRVAFICAGNICRSAYAQAKARQLGLPSVSAGLAISDGLPANPDSIRHARARGVCLESHRTTNIRTLRFAAGDLILCMEPDQASSLSCRIGPGIQMSLLGLWSNRRKPYIHDPYGLNDFYWSNCLTTIDNAVENIHRHIETSRSIRLGE